VAIKDRRTKDGDLQYRVAYDLDPDSRTYWASSHQLSCSDLIEKFEAEASKSKPSKRGPRTSLAKVTEVLGLSHYNNELYYVVRFGDSPEPHFVTRAYAIRRCARSIADFYQKYLTFESEMSPDEFERLLERGGQPRSPADAPAAAPEPSPGESDNEGSSDTASDV
jgi:hypothetical protein